MRIAGKQAQIGREEIAQHVDLSALAPGTDVRAFVVAHEGDSRPINADTGRVVALSWGRAVVRRIAELAKAGIKFVRSHTDRAEVGEVVGSWTADVGGKLRAIVAGAFKPGAAMGMDICSIEADGVNDTNGVVTEVGVLERIALGDSRSEQPGFPGAVLAGAIHAFTDSDGRGLDVQPPNLDHGDNMPENVQQAPVTLRSVKEFLELNPGVQPGQLFEDAAIEAHPTVATKLGEVGGKLTKAEAKVESLSGQIARTGAKSAMQAKITGWTPEAQFHANTAFDGWTAATDNPAKLDEWVATAAERYKAGTGQEAVKPADPNANANANGAGDGAGDANANGNAAGAAGSAGPGAAGTGGGTGGSGGQPANSPQPNHPPDSTKPDPVAALSEALGITTKKAA